jgi:hypothetical protein
MRQLLLKKFKPLQINEANDFLERYPSYHFAVIVEEANHVFKNLAMRKPVLTMLEGCYDKMSPLANLPREVVAGIIAPKVAPCLAKNMQSQKSKSKPSDEYEDTLGFKIPACETPRPRL